jgi:uncharacterized membrane protein
VKRHYFFLWVIVIFNALITLFFCFFRSLDNDSAMSAQTRYELFCHPLLLIFAGGLNLPPLAFGILGYTTWCAFFSGWLVVNACVSALNMVAALYAVYRIKRLSNPEPSRDQSESIDEAEKEIENGTYCNGSEGEEFSEEEAPGVADNGKETTCLRRYLRRRTISSDRVRRLLCYDGVIATYSIMFLFWIFWLLEGTQRTRNYDLASEDDLEGCADFHFRYQETSIICGFSYASFVFLSMLASLWK